ncbi:carboxylesterase [Paenibacillus sp. YN15]|uniref:alpha/beta hydrolase n=1 Tax=Paenibacillus sp. YN15 TaxID=1742774 RepID=UPI000DCB9318|nr:alpha/beta fold hydrolase [Paenibacillus sp. YN15]RAV02725.1 carboxylesterase [Paenibacillus sp. YN15]
MQTITAEAQVLADKGPADRQFGTPEPFFLEGWGEHKGTVALLIHGFTGSPSEFRRLGYHLNDLGYTVKAILLPGHGTTPEDMIRTGSRDWWSCVRDEFAVLVREGYDKVIPIGHSMGGLLSLKLAMEEQVPGVVTLATPIHLGSRTLMFAPWVQFFIKYVSKRRPAGWENMINESLAYDRTPVPCVVHFRKLLFHVKKKLDRVSVPLFIAQGELDRAALPASAPYIYSRVSSQKKEMKVYPNSSHGILLDSDREEVYQDISMFIAQLG